MGNSQLKLTAIDRKLLYELDMDARQSISALAKKTRSSPAGIEYRMKRMEKSGLIRKYITFLDAGKLGLMVWNVYLKLQNATSKEEKEILDYLASLKRTWWVASCSGKWDIIYSLCVKDVKEFYSIAADVHNRYGEFITDQNIEAHAEVEIISRGYFVKKGGMGSTWYKAIEKSMIDGKDLKILKAIAENARLMSTDVAKKTGLTSRIVSYRIAELQKNGIIHRFRLVLDVSKIGMSFYKVVVHLKNYTERKNFALKQHCIDEGNIFHYEQKIGSWMLELELDAGNYESADRQMKRMKEKFPDFIRDYELLLITGEPKAELDLTKQI